MLGEIASPGQYASDLLRSDVRPLLGKRLDVALSTYAVSELAGGGGLVTRSSAVTDEEFLALCLQWVIDSKLAILPIAIVSQIAGLAARIFDHPLVAQHAVSTKQSAARKGRGKDYDISPARRTQIIARALKRRDSEDRDLVVSDLCSQLGGVSRSTASRILAKEGWTGRSGRRIKKA